MSAALDIQPKLEIEEPSLIVNALFSDIDRALKGSSIEQLDEILDRISEFTYVERGVLMGLFQAKTTTLGVDDDKILQKIGHVIQVILAAMDDNLPSY